MQMIVKKVHLDKVGSACLGAGIGKVSFVSDSLVAKEGYVVAARVLTDKLHYHHLEDQHGRMTRVKPGDLIAGVLGQRRALHGYAGRVPESVAVGDRLQLLNLGGVMGICTSYNPAVGQPFELEVLGAVLHFPHLGSRRGEPAHIGLHLPETGSGREQREGPPLIGIVGTCMNSGKTAAACEIIHGLSRRGARVGGAKLTGVSLRRDTLNMLDHGAVQALSFSDVGVVSTRPENSVKATHRILEALALGDLDYLVCEFGDGIFGDYGVQDVLRDSRVRGKLTRLLLCAIDPAGAWGGKLFLERDLGLAIDGICGPVTDNEVGCQFVERELGLPSGNALRDSTSLLEMVTSAVSSQGAQHVLP